ncbi:MAG: ATP-binding protein, partial [Culicoidibacterales bacterium]
AEVKGNYTGALVTRVKSLTVGLNRFIFTDEQTPYAKLFDENCILDMSRVKSTETKALLMGLVVYLLNEYRMDQKTGSNHGLKHVTVLEEAHNLLKNTAQQGSSELVGKSVEILTNTIAEIRTYGEGFIIVDQSPSSVDIAAIKNTNTKIVLRTPEANDRETVGRSMGLTEDQVNEIAKLPSGVAVVYQNDWLSPVLTMVDKADVVESVYKHEQQLQITPYRVAVTQLLRVILQPWLSHEQQPVAVLTQALTSVQLPQQYRRLVMTAIEVYTAQYGKMQVKVTAIPEIQTVCLTLMQVTPTQLDAIILTNNPQQLRQAVMKKTYGLTKVEIEEICHVLTMRGE